MSTTWTHPDAQAAFKLYTRVAKATCTTGTETFAPKGVYAAGTTYAAGDMVVKGGIPYLSMAADNVGNDPAADDGTHWASMAQWGIDLRNLASVTAHVELADFSGTIGANASLKVWILNPATGEINRAPTLDAALTAGIPAQALDGWQITGPVGRLIALPDTVGAACNVYLNGSIRPGLLSI